MFITEDKEENIATLWGSIEDMQKIVCLMSYVVGDYGIDEALMEARMTNNLHPDDCFDVLKQSVEQVEIKDGHICVLSSFKVTE